MEQVNEQEVKKVIYQRATSLIVSKDISKQEVKRRIVADGFDTKLVSPVVNSIYQQIDDENKQQGQKDMGIGAVVCLGGIIATVGNFGYVFWGAIIFGAIQFFRGLATYNG